MLPQGHESTAVKSLPFRLPDGAIHSSFPPPGQGALPKALPHVVLADEHLPWARVPSKEHSTVPWLAVLVFTHDELTIPAHELRDMFSETALKDNVRQTETLAVTMKAADVAKLKSTVSPMTAVQGDDEEETTDVVLVPSTLFAELVTTYSTNGDAVPQTSPDVSRYKYLAHTRQINTNGMAEEDEAYFSVVLSHRTGPLAGTQPQPVVAHLVSIERVEDMNWPLNHSKNPRVAMASLHSWNFNTLPAGSPDMSSTLQKLGQNVAMLRAPDPTISSEGSTPAQRWMRQRLHDGYTLAKHRTQTDEETAVIMRGPLTPVHVPYLLRPSSSALAWFADSDSDLQILDPEVGLLDMTYSVAWHLGRSLALADGAFTIALTRLRNALYDGAKRAAAQAKGALGASEPRGADALADLNSTLAQLADHQPRRPLGRWPRPSQPPLDESAILDKHMLAARETLMTSTDWKTVLAWLLDRVLLRGIPTSYLIVDPSHLPPESMRLFHIDRNWVDALLDGALSPGNNNNNTSSGRGGGDVVRRRLHAMLRSHLDDDHATSVPTHGFLLRSTAVTLSPDHPLRIASVQVADGGGAPILRHDILAADDDGDDGDGDGDGVLLCLPGGAVPPEGGMRCVTFAPPHGQTFSAADELSGDVCRTVYKRAGAAGEGGGTCRERVWRRDGGGEGEGEGEVRHAAAVFKWGEARTLLMPAWVGDLKAAVGHCGGEGEVGKEEGDGERGFSDAAVVAFQLSDPVVRLVVRNELALSESC